LNILFFPGQYFSAGQGKQNCSPGQFYFHDTKRVAFFNDTQWIIFSIQGEELKHTTTPMKDTCLQQCKFEVDGCQWISYNGVNQECFTFSSCPTIDESNIDFISSEVGCKLPGNL
jgi:hypothetical protein